MNFAKRVSILFLFLIGINMALRIPRTELRVIERISQGSHQTWNDLRKVSFFHQTIIKGHLHVCRYLLENVLVDFDENRLNALAYASEILEEETFIKSSYEYVTHNEPRLALEFIRLFQEYGLDVENNCYQNKLYPVYFLLAWSIEHDLFKETVNIIEFTRFNELIALALEENFNPELVHHLIDANADFFSFADSRGRNALMIAIDFKQFTLAERLVHQVDINAKDAKGLTVLDRLHLYQSVAPSLEASIREASGWFGSLYSAWQHNEPDFAFKHVEAGGNINECNENGPIIYHILQFRDFDVVSALLNAGADVNRFYYVKQYPRLCRQNLLAAAFTEAIELVNTFLIEEYLFGLLPVVKEIASRTEDLDSFLEQFHETSHLLPEFFEIINSEKLKRQ